MGIGNVIFLLYSQPTHKIVRNPSNLTNWHFAGVLPRGRAAERRGSRQDLGPVQDQAQEPQVAVPLHQGVQITLLRP